MSVVKIMVLAAMLSHYQAGESFETPQVDVPPVQQVGLASWYGNGAWHGEITANGEQFDPSDFTCAHRNLPFDTVVLIENRANGRRVWCRINDRGPYGYKSDDGSWDFRVSSSSEVNFRGILDMSVATAEALGTTQVGLQRVNLRYWKRRPEEPFDLAVLNP